MALSYFGTRLSENILANEQGIVCKDAVIARTGPQVYKTEDLPQERVKELNLDLEPGQEVELWRVDDEVFDPATIASFEGKVFTLNHPKSFVGVENGDGMLRLADVAKGHVQNVRRGGEPLDSGYWPLLADIVVNDKSTIDRILDGGLRELSCGYGFNITKKGEKILQVDIRGNHVALVDKGRAGPEARIYDSAPTAAEPAATEEQPIAVAAVDNDSIPTISEPVNSVPVPEAVIPTETAAVAEADQGPATTPQAVKSGAITTRKNGTGRRHTVSNVLKNLLGLLQYAADADEGAEKSVGEIEGSNDPKGSVSLKEGGEIERVGDSQEDEPKEEKKEAAASDRRRADDKRKTNDKRADDRRSRAHRSLDRLMDEMAERESKEEEERAEDTDLEELKQLLSSFFNEEEGEPEHEEGEQAEDLEGFEAGGTFHPIRGSEGYKRTKAGDPKKKRRARDAEESEFVEPVEGEEEESRAADARAMDGFEMLRDMRPLVAALNSKFGRHKEIKAFTRYFNAKAAEANDSVGSRRNGGERYGQFLGASRTPSKAAMDSERDARVNPEQQFIDEFVNAHKAVHGKPIGSASKGVN